MIGAKIQPCFLSLSLTEIRYILYTLILLPSPMTQVPSARQHCLLDFDLQFASLDSEGSIVGDQN